MTKQISNSNMASIESDYDFNEIDISWFEQNCIPAELLFGTDYESILLEIENHAKFKRRKRRRNSDFTSKNSILDEEQVWL